MDNASLRQLQQLVAETHVRSVGPTVQSGRRQWAASGTWIASHLISLGENGFSESFFSPLRDEVLNIEEFMNLAEARWSARRRLINTTTNGRKALGYPPGGIRGPLLCFRSEVAFGYASSSFSAPAEQRH